VIAQAPDERDVVRPAPGPGRSRRGAGPWPWVPALLLGTLIGVQLLVVSATIDDPTFSSEQDYYRKAVDWDAHMARLRASRALGWSAHVSVEQAASPGARTLSLRFEDAAGAPLSGAALEAVAFHNARAASPRALDWREVAPGLYHAELAPARPGLWELRLSAARGADRYEATLRFEAPLERSAP
jgi:nitrogen fixation protein FixH